MQPLPTPIPTSRSRCPAAPFLSLSGPFTNQGWRRPVARFAPDVKPSDPVLVAAVERELARTA